MASQHKLFQLVLITGCLFIAAVSYTHAEEKKQTQVPDMSAMMNPMMNMMNPAMYMTMMNPMMGSMMNPMAGMMNPMMGMNMMNPMMMGMGAPMMGSMMNPMMGMNMMYPMMGMMGPMMNPMMGMNMMPNTGTTSSYNNSMGQMMDPKQYEQWFSQWTEMMKNFSPQPQPQATN